MTRIAFVLGNDFEDVEFETPHTTLLRHGLEIDVIGSDTGEVTGKRGTKVPIDKSIDAASADDYDVLVIPGGFSPDHLRTDDRVVDFIRAFDDQDKVIAAVCHGPSLLIEAGVVDGRTMTSWPSIRTDLRNAGADVVDREVAVDGRYITSRNPDDLPAFTDTILASLGDADPQRVAGDNSFTA
jgi:protease I